MSNRILTSLGALGFLLAGACGPDTHIVEVQLLTDLSPGTEFDQVETTVEFFDGGSWDFLDRRSVMVVNTEDARTIALFTIPVSAEGRYAFEASLRLEANELLRQRVEVDIAGATTVSILAQHECLAVQNCGTPETPTCLSGSCVSAECAGDPAACSTTCAQDADCTSSNACVETACVLGHCFAYTPGTGEASCDPGLICTRDQGCSEPAGTLCNGATERLCERQDGVCAGGVAECVNGVFMPCGIAEFGARYQPDETLCDGLDNDCDGRTDETSSLCPRQAGVCSGSERVCGGPNGFLACDYFTHDARYEAIETTCDGIDNDCDGDTDEDAGRTACPLQDGVCAGSRAACGMGSLDCSPAEYGTDYQALETTCDGLDNDCDRRVDEALTPPACTLQQGVCNGATQRCAGALGFLDCTGGDYGERYELEETLCDGYDNDCDGTIDEDITRDCDLGCGTGTETCSDGTFVACDAAVRTVLSDISLAPGTYSWDCVDVPDDRTVDFEDAVEVLITRDLNVEGTVNFRGRGNILRAEDVVITTTGTVTAGHLNIEATNLIQIEEGGRLDGTGLFSGGGGAACSSRDTRGVASGGSGGHGGANGGQGGGCGGISGFGGGPGVGGGVEGLAGLDCTTELSTSINMSGAAGGPAPAGSGGGGGAGGAGGRGGNGFYPNDAWAVSGAPGGAPANSSGAEPTNGGGGGGGAGSELDGRSRAECGETGGGGGAYFRLQADSVDNRGRIAADGENRRYARLWSRAGTAGGGGGGAVILVANMLSNVGTITASGGTGASQIGHETVITCPANSGGSGGGGGGGYVYLDISSASAGSVGRISVGGGRGGTIDCAGEAGTAGSPGIVCCTRSIAGCTPC